MKTSNFLSAIILSFFFIGVAFNDVSAQGTIPPVKIVDANGNAVKPGEGDILVGKGDGTFEVVNIVVAVKPIAEPNTGVSTSTVPEDEYGPVTFICDDYNEDPKDDCPDYKISPLAGEDAYSVLLKLQPKQFDKQPGKDGPRQLYGMLGSQVSKTAPAAAFKNPNGSFSIYQDGIDALLVGAFQQMASELKEKDKAISDLESRIAALEAKIK